MCLVFTCAILYSPYFILCIRMVFHAVSSINARILDVDGIQLWRVKGPLKIDYSSCSSNCEHRSHLSFVLFCYEIKIVAVKMKCIRVISYILSILCFIGIAHRITMQKNECATIKHLNIRRHHMFVYNHIWRE